MDPIQKILVIVDPTAEKHPSVQKGTLLAEKLGARLDLFCCDTSASRQTRFLAHRARHSDRPFQPDVKAFLEELAAPIRARGLDVTTITDCADHLHLALEARTKRTNADLVVKDTHHHSLLKRTLLTNTDWHLVRTCPVPLLLTKEAEWAAAPKWLAALDPGHVNDKLFTLDHHILDHLSYLSKRLGGELHALHAYYPIAPVIAPAAGALPMIMTLGPEEIAAEERRKREQVQQVVAQYAVPAKNIHIELGGPTEVLPRMAGTLHADVLAMGVLSRSALRRALIGGTAEHVLERLPCDALVIKPPDFASLLPF